MAATSAAVAAVMEAVATTVPTCKHAAHGVSTWSGGSGGWQGGRGGSNLGGCTFERRPRAPKMGLRRTRRSGATIAGGRTGRRFGLWCRLCHVAALALALAMASAGCGGDAAASAAAGGSLRGVAAGLWARLRPCMTHEASRRRAEP